MAPDNGAGLPGLRPCKRYICTHDANGKSVYAESPGQVYNGPMARSYSIGSIPAVLTDDTDIKAYRSETGANSHRGQSIVAPGSGANLIVFELAPGVESAMHQTVSIDFSICVQGEVDHELDGGEKVRLYPGDHVVQRGTNHRWSNPSKTQPARCVAVTLPCVPFEVAGEMLREVHVPSAQWDKMKAKL